MKNLKYFICLVLAGIAIFALACFAGCDESNKDINNEFDEIIYAPLLKDIIGVNYWIWEEDLNKVYTEETSIPNLDAGKKYYLVLDYKFREDGSVREHNLESFDEITLEFDSENLQITPLLDDKGIEKDDNNAKVYTIECSEPSEDILVNVTLVVDPRPVNLREYKTHFTLTFIDSENN